MTFFLETAGHDISLNVKYVLFTPNVTEDDPIYLWKIENANLVEKLFDISSIGTHDLRDTGPTL